jgi:hypothetical protein
VIPTQNQNRGIVVEGALINAVYALYGKPEPAATTPTTKIANDLREMAAEKRREDAEKQIPEGY